MSEGKKDKLKKSSGLSRLTDPSLYPGAHKHRFGADGKGRGLAGRDSGGVERGAVHSLSQLTRSNLHSGGTVLPVGRAASKSVGGGLSPKKSPASPPAASPPRARAATLEKKSPGAGSPPGEKKSSLAAAGGAVAGSPEGKKQRLKQAGGLSRLTDPSLYPGAHKHRFGADGRGKGLAGRDSGGVERGAVHSLSQLVASKR